MYNDRREKVSPTKAIRRHCLTCCCGSPAEVKACSIQDCWLHPFRMGKNPYRAPATQKQLENARKIGAQLKNARNRHASGEKLDTVKVKPLSKKVFSENVGFVGRAGR